MTIASVTYISVDFLEYLTFSKAPIKIKSSNDKFVFNVF